MSSAALPETSPLPVPLFLNPNETLVAWMHSDVTADGRFAETYISLTTHRLVQSDSQGQLLSQWELTGVSSLKTRDRAGLGTLEAFSDSERLAVWHYGLTEGPAVLILMERFECLQAGRNPFATQDDTPEPPDVEVSSPAPNTFALFRLWEFTRSHQLAIIFALLISITATIASIIPLKLTGPLVDEILTPYQYAAQAQAGSATPTVQPADLLVARWYLLGMVAAAVLAWLLGWAQGAMLAWVSERISGDLRNRTYSHLQKLSLEYFGGKRTGDLINRVSTDSDRLCQFLSDSVVDFVADTLLLIVIAMVLFQTSLPLALATLLPFPFVVWLMYVSRDRLQAGFATSSRAWSSMTSVLADTIPGIRVVKAFAQEEREIDRFRTANAHVVAANNRVNSVWTFFWPLIAFLNSLGVLVVWACGIYLIAHLQLTVGALLEFVLLSSRFYGRLESMSRMINASQRAAASAQRIFEVLDRVSSVPEPAHPVPLERVRGDIELRNVGFRYGNRKVIRNVNLRIAPGEMVGLVGPTGAGKSTLINLICRFFDVAEGAIYVDGIDLRAYRVTDYRRNIGLVLQEPFLFFGTIAENIAYGRPEATRAEIIAAAQAAHAHDFILQLPDAYDSLVGERGQTLSGGERQRISIARALLIDPAILILDEATSAVDTETEREIQSALRNLVKGRTTLAIAHRLSTLRQANRIVVLQQGRFVEIGTHEELLAKDGAYMALHRAQQALTKDISW